MPEIIFKADQGAGVRKIIRIMQGDTRSHVIRFVVPRYDSGVDLAPLVWYIKFVDAEGVSDIVLPSAMYEVTADDIRVRWTVNGISTDAVGNTKFQLCGVGKDAEGYVISWTSGAGEIEVTENIGFEVSDEDEEKLSALDELIVFVQGELNGVIAAGNNAAAAAARAEAAAEGAVDATAAAIRANEAAEAAEKAAANANNVMDVKANALAASATGNPVQIHPDKGSTIKPVLTLLPVQSGSGEPSPDNIRPITGRTGTELGRCRKNLVSYDYNGGTVQGVTVTKNEDGYYTLNGTPTASGIAILATLTLPPGTYTLSLDAASGSCSTTEQTAGQLVAADTNALLIAVRPNVLKSSCTLTERTKVWVRLFVNSATTYNNWKIRICLAAGADAASEPYQGDTYVLDFGQTVYGGTLDWNKGEMMVDRAMATLDGNSNITIAAGIAQSEGYTKFHTHLSATDALLGSDKEVPDALCNMFPVRKVSGNVTGVIPEGNCISASSTSGAWYIVAQNSIASTADEMKALLAETPLQLIYKLATPITIQLTPQQITALAGMNMVYSDADDMVVTYNRDLANAYEELRNAIIAMGGNV